MTYQWNWAVFNDLSPDGTHTYLETLGIGLGWTLAVALTAGVIAFVLGSLIGIARTLPNKWLSYLANAYIELFRNIPLLVQMFLWYFVGPELLPTTLGDWIKSLPTFITAVIALGFYTSARLAVQTAASMSALPKGQHWAAHALGFTLPQTYRYVLLPISFRMLIPVFTSEFLNLIKNSAVALTIGVVELTANAYAMQEFTFQTFEALSAATLIYILLNVVVLTVMRFVERRTTIVGLIASHQEGR